MRASILKQSISCFLAAACIASSSSLRAEESADTFPFTIPWDDSTSGTITDVSFLNARPAGVNGRIIAKGEEFIEEKTGKPIRFLGTNLAGKSNFPSHEDAEKVAARMAKYGINIVRLHHMDNDWDLKKGTGIWRKDDPRHQEIDPDQLDRLDYLVAQFKKHGIYVNINLKVSKRLGPADGFDPAITKIPFNYQKRVDKFDRRMIDLQKDFARKLLTHINPYTRLSYVQDPAVAAIEINNENSLVADIAGVPGAGLNKLPEPWRGDLARLWNMWLVRKYGQDDSALSKTWANTTPADLPAVLKPDAKWILGLQGKAKADLNFAEGENDAASSAAQVNITHVDGTDYHIQLHIPQINIKPEIPYTMSFSAKSSVNRNIRVAVMRDRDDYRNNGIHEGLKLTSEWRDFTFSFMPQDIKEGQTRLTFTMGLIPSQVSIRNLKLEPGAPSAGLQPEQSLAKGNIDLPAVMTAEQRRDWIRFLTDTEHNYALEMRNFLREELKVRSSIIDSQITWGGITGYTREAEMDFADGHEYWQHPNFLTGGWDNKNWTIGNTPMVNEWLKGETATLGSSAMTRVAGKPFTVSEYDHPAPSDFVCEMMPLLSSIAAVQAWNAVYTFDYGQYGSDVRNDQVHMYFDQGSHVAKISLYPAAAAIFRMGLLQPASAQRTLQLPAQPYDRWLSVRTAWLSASPPMRPVDLFNFRWNVDPSSGVANAKVIQAGAPSAGQQSLRMDRINGKGLFVAHSPKAAIVVGTVSGQSIDAGDATFSFDTFASGFAAATLTAMDAQPLSESQRILLTIVGRAQNQEMGWNSARTSVSDKWGRGPMLVDKVSAKISIKTSGPRQVYALGNTGQRIREVHAKFAGGTLTFDFNPEDATTWYELSRDASQK